CQCLPLSLPAALPILTAPSEITADAPVLLAQYSPGQSFDGVISDPFMMLIPPSEQFLNSYNFATLTQSVGFRNSFVNVMAPTGRSEEHTSELQSRENL